jgi:hypothetical protein
MVSVVIVTLTMVGVVIVTLTMVGVVIVTLTMVGVIVNLTIGRCCYCNLQNATGWILSSLCPVKMYITINCLVLLNGCETWSRTLREEHRLRVLENRVLREIFGFERDEVTGEWRRLRNVELHDLHSSPNIRLMKAR